MDIEEDLEEQLMDKIYDIQSCLHQFENKPEFHKMCDLIEDVEDFLKFLKRHFSDDV